MKHIVHENAYRKMDGDELREMLLSRCEVVPYEQWVTAFCNRKYNSDFSREMTRSVEEYLLTFGMKRGGSSENGGEPSK